MKRKHRFEFEYEDWDRPQEWHKEEFVGTFREARNQAFELTYRPTGLGRRRGVSIYVEGQFWKEIK